MSVIYFSLWSIFENILFIVLNEKRREREATFMEEWEKIIDGIQSRHLTLQLTVRV